jgi:elongation factor Ts
MSIKLKNNKRLIKMKSDILEKIKILRNKTGISIIECKNALLKNSLNIENSISYLKEKGIITASLKSNKNTNEGLISILINDNKKQAIISEINCETDFVAKSQEFKIFTKILNSYLLYDDKYNKKTTLLINPHLENDIENKRIELITKLGENILIKRVKKISIENGFICGYAHGSDNTGKIASLVIFDLFSENYSNLYMDITMQVTAMHPLYLNIESIPKDTLEKEKFVNKEIKNFYKENVLLEQSFIKNSNINISDIILHKFKILDFIRFEVGEE